MNSVVILSLFSLGYAQTNLASSAMPATETEYHAIVVMDPKPTWADFQAQVEIHKTKLGLTLLRSARNRMIASCDWLMTADNLETLANKDEWIAYRRALRDLPDSGLAIVFAPDHSSLDLSAMTLPVQRKVVRK